ncbi:MAG: acyl-CoA dehydrogenase [Proteobacteria bacterium]|nr:acyl-CoA dehydrogenase [Pseudomonadota bacterium]
MSLILSEEQAMLRDTAQSFLAENAPVAHLRELRDRHDADGFSRSLWATFAELGFTGILAPEAHGGLGLGHVEAGVVMEQIGRNLTPSPFLSSALLTVTALVRGADEARQAEWLPKIISGELIGALAVDEGPKHRPPAVSLRAERAGTGFRLNGVKSFVVDGHVADLLVVAARTGGAPVDQAGLTLFVVDAKAPGLTVERTVMVDSHNAARLRLENVTVDADAVLGQADGGWTLLEGVLNVGRAAVASELVGVADEVFGRTLSYLRERKQFGRAIGEFQALQHRAAHLYTEIEIAKAAVINSLQTLDESFEGAAAAVSVAKAKAGSVASLAVQEAVQMHGGMGMTDEYDIGLYMKRDRVLNELFGDPNYHADKLARLKGY